MEFRKSAPLQSSIDRGKTLDIGIPAPTRLTLTGGQIPHLKLLRRGNQSFHRGPLRRHFPMPPSAIRLRYDDSGREMHQPRGILCVDRSAKPLYRYNGPRNPNHNHRATSNAPATQGRRVCHPMPGWGVSTPLKSNNAPHTHTNLTDPSHTQSDRHRSLARHNTR